MELRGQLLSSRPEIQLPSQRLASRSAAPVQDEVWEARLKELLEFQRFHGHPNVPRGWSRNRKLAIWVLNQRRFVRLGTLREDRLRRFEECGIAWAEAEERQRAQQETWDRMHSALRAFKRAFGHLQVPRGWPVEPALAAWIASQRFLRKNGSLASARERKLDELGLRWSRPLRSDATGASAKESRNHEAAWEKACADLEAYRLAHGDCAVPSRWPENPKLARWVLKQRILKKRGALDRKRIEHLERIGFVWSGRARNAAAGTREWDAMRSELEVFLGTHGHLDVPSDFAESPRLAEWARRQRSEYRRGRLSPERIRRLEELKFPWSPRISRVQELILGWEKKFAELACFVRDQGHAEVPKGELARWVDDQRRRKQGGTLSADRTRRLESLGLCWSLHEKRWEAHFARLAGYRREHGDCNVPTSPSKNPELARWVSAQRTARREGRLDPARQARLDAIGFLWVAPRPAPFVVR